MSSLDWPAACRLPSMLHFKFVILPIVQSNFTKQLQNNVHFSNLHTHTFLLCIEEEQILLKTHINHRHKKLTVRTI